MEGKRAKDKSLDKADQAAAQKIAAMEKKQKQKLESKQIKAINRS